MNDESLIRDRLAGLRAAITGRRITRSWCRRHALRFWAHFLTLDFDGNPELVKAQANVEQVYPEVVPECPVCLAALDDEQFAALLKGFRPLTEPRR